MEKNHGVVTINTAKSKGVIGFVKGKTFNLDDVVIAPHETRQDWATINLTVVDGEDFKRAKRILVTATGYAENTDMHWKNAGKSSVGSDWGKAPSLVEGIAATITLPVAAARAWSLDECGQRNREIPLKTEGGRCYFDLGPEWKTLWYEVETQ